MKTLFKGDGFGGELFQFAQGALIDFVLVVFPEHDAKEIRFAYVQHVEGMR